MKGRAIHYSTTQLQWVSDNRALPRKELHRQFCEKFARTDVSQQNLTALCKRKNWHTGRDGRYVPGQSPANKGKKMPYNANSARTQFKKGHEPANTKYLGHERLSKDGYVEISVDQTNPHTGYGRRYVHKHRYLWEKENGPIPENMVLKCIDGDKQHTDPANWKLIPRAMLPRLNGRFGRNYEDAPAQLKPVILAVATLEHKSRELQKDKTA